MPSDNLKHHGYQRYNAFPHLAYLELSSHFIEWYRRPPNSPAPGEHSPLGPFSEAKTFRRVTKLFLLGCVFTAVLCAEITTEKLFFFYNLQPANNSCPGDPLGPGRFVLADREFPLEDRLYATLQLNQSAELSLTSGRASARVFHAAPGINSFEVPRFPGRQRLKVMRDGVVLADVVGAELVNASSDPAVLARCDHQTFTGSAELRAAGPAPAPAVRFGPPMLIEGSNSTNEGSCHPVYMTGLDSPDGSRVVAGQLGLPWTGWHGSVYARSSAPGSAWSRQQHLAGLFSQNFPSQCASPCTNVSTFGTLVPLGPGEAATGFSFTGEAPDVNQTGQLRVSALPSSVGVACAQPRLPVRWLWTQLTVVAWTRFSPTGVRTVFRGLPKEVISGAYTSGGARLARGGTASVRLRDGSLLQTAIVTFKGQEHFRSPNATSIVVFRSVGGVTWDFRAIVADAADYLASEEGPNEHDMTFLPDGSTLLLVMRM